VGTRAGAMAALGCRRAAKRAGHAAQPCRPVSESNRRIICVVRCIQSHAEALRRNYLFHNTTGGKDGTGKPDIVL